MIDNGGWNQWAKYILMSLEKLEKQATSSELKNEELQLLLIKEIGEIRGDLKVINQKITQKATLTGALAGALAGASRLPADWINKVISSNRTAYGIDIEENAHRFFKAVYKKTC